MCLHLNEHGQFIFQNDCWGYISQADCLLMAELLHVRQREVSFDAFVIGTGFELHCIRLIVRQRDNEYMDRYKYHSKIIYLN